MDSGLIVTRSYSGGRDLYHGVPNLKDSVVSEVTTIEEGFDYVTVLTLTRPDGYQYNIQIRQER